MKLWPNADQLPDFLPAESMLPRWGCGGSLKFDLDECTLRLQSFDQVSYWSLHHSTRLIVVPYTDSFPAKKSL